MSTALHIIREALVSTPEWITLRETLEGMVFNTAVLIPYVFHADKSSEFNGKVRLGNISYDGKTIGFRMSSVFSFTKYISPPTDRNITDVITYVKYQVLEDETFPYPEIRKFLKDERVVFEVSHMVDYFSEVSPLPPSFPDEFHVEIAFQQEYSSWIDLSGRYK